jgi:hypothetical protein
MSKWCAFNNLGRGTGKYYDIVRLPFGSHGNFILASSALGLNALRCLSSGCLRYSNREELFL